VVEVVAVVSGLFTDRCRLHSATSWLGVPQLAEGWGSVLSQFTSEQTRYFPVWCVEPESVFASSVCCCNNSTWLCHMIG
jgi:hypothetical protein